MKRKIFIITAVVFVITLVLFTCAACGKNETPREEVTKVGEELVQNGKFTSFNATTKQFEGWTSYSSKTSGFAFGVSYPSDITDSNVRLYIDNSSAMYSNMQQRIHVDTNKIYKVSVDIWVTTQDGLSGDYGAYVAFLENTEYKFAYTKQHTDGMVTKTFYVRPRNTDYLTLALCLGTQEQGVAGHVLFDNVSMRRMNDNQVPDSVTVYEI